MRLTRFCFNVQAVLILLASTFIVSTASADETVAGFSKSSKSKASSSQPLFERLFTTPQQRKALNYGRLHGYTPSQSTNAETNQLAQPTQSNQPIRLMGVLLRSDGKNKVWLNGVSDNAQNSFNNRAIGGSITNSANVKVPLRGTITGAILKPGQVWNPNKNRVEEAYQIPVPKPVPVEVAPVVTSSSSSTSSASSAETSSVTQTSSTNNSEVRSSVPSAK